MRILAVIDVLSFQPAGGAGTVLIEAGRALARRGHEVRVACRRRTDLPEQGEVLGLHVRTYSADTARPWSLWTRGRRTTIAAYEEGGRPDAVWAHHALPTLWLSRRFARDRVPCVYTFHSPWHEEHLTRLGHAPGALDRLSASVRRRCEARAIDRAAVVTVLSRAMGLKLATVHGRREAVDVVPGGADLERFRPAPDREAARTALGADSGTFLVATVRSLIPRVGIDRLIEAFAVLRDSLPRARLLVGGQGPLRDSLEARATALGLGDSARFLGFVADADLPALLSAADVVAMPSVELEGFGLVAAEAIACGTPVVSTPVGGLPEVIAPLDPSWVADGVDPESIAAALLRVARSTAPRTEVQARCRRHAEARFGWDRFAEGLERAIAAGREKTL